MLRAVQSASAATAAAAGRHATARRALSGVSVRPTPARSAWVVRTSGGPLQRGTPARGAPWAARQLSSTTEPKAEPGATTEGEAASETTAADETAATAAAAEAEAQAQPSAEEVVEKLNAKVEALEAETKDAKEQMLYTLAEMENLRQRTKKDIENKTTYANQKFAKSLLDVADNLSRALDSVPAEALAREDHGEHLASLHEGISMTEKELVKIFNANGITGFGENGEAFDPHKHEAMFQMPTNDQPANVIAQVLKKGYMLKDRVLRPAQVGTTKPE